MTAWAGSSCTWPMQVVSYFPPGTKIVQSMLITFLVQTKTNEHGIYRYRCLHR
jgi:hypothetical protein